MKNILVIKHGSLGDIVQALGVMKTIRQEHPDDKITVMTTDAYRKLLNMTGFFDNVIIDNRPHYSPSNWYRVCKKVLAEGGWDMVYDLQLSRRTKRYWRISTFLTNKPVVWAFWQKMKEKPLGFDFYTSEAKKKFMPAKFTKRFEQVDFPFPSMAFCKGTGENFSLLPEKYALIMPGCSAGNTYKRWPVEKYVELVRKLKNEGLISVISGTKAEENEINTICEKVPGTFNFMGKSSIYDIPSLAEKAEVVVGNDTGPVHIAGFSNAKTVVLYCEKNSFVSVDMPNVTNIIKPNINDIETDEVFGAVNKFLSDKGR